MFLIAYPTSPDTAWNLLSRRKQENFQENVDELPEKYNRFGFIWLHYSHTAVIGNLTKIRTEPLVFLPKLNVRLNIESQQEPGTPASPALKYCSSADRQSHASKQVHLNWVSLVSEDGRCHILEKWCLRSPCHPPKYLLWGKAVLLVSSEFPLLTHIAQSVACAGPSLSVAGTHPCSWTLGILVELLESQQLHCHLVAFEHKSKEESEKMIKTGNSEGGGTKTSNPRMEGLWSQWRASLL